MHRMCSHCSSHICCGNASVAKVLTVAGRKTDKMHLSQKRKLPLPSFASSTTFLYHVLSLSNIRALCQMVQHQLVLDHAAINVM